MSNYIGNQPAFGEFKKLDSIVSLFNGSTTQFNLEYNSVNQSVGDATQLIVSLNGVVQEPGTAYTLGIGGGSVVFASAPASTDTCHIVLLGGVGGTTTPTDGSVTASKLDSNLKDYLEETFTADGTQTVFTLTRAVVGANTLLVTIDGIVQPSSAFTASGTTLTISEVLAVNTNVRVVHMGVKAGVYVPADDSVTPDMLANSINTDIAAGVAALPKAGGTMTGALTTTVLTVGDGHTIGNDASDNLKIVSSAGENFILSTGDDFFVYAGSDTRRLKVDSSGDISFYEDTGTTAKFFWDASEENLGIGGASTFTSGTNIEVMDSNVARLGFTNTSAGGSQWAWFSGTSGQAALYDYDNSRQAMTIDSSGNVGIGTSSPTLNLHVAGGAGGIRYAASSGASTLLYSDTNAGYLGTENNYPVIIQQNNAERMRIHSAGRVGIGTSGNTIQGSLVVKDVTDHNGADVFVVAQNTTSNRIAGFKVLDESGTTSLQMQYDNGGNDASIINPNNGSLAIYLGGTGSANKLDDYEEGSLTMTGFSTSSGLSAVSHQYAVYVKVGNLVNIWGRVNVTPTTTGRIAWVMQTPISMYASTQTGQNGTLSAYPYATDKASGYIVDNSGSDATGFYCETSITSTNLSAISYHISYYSS